MINGTTGEQIGGALNGDSATDQLGFANDEIDGASVTTGLNGVTALANSNYVVASSFDNENSLSDVGSVRLVNGSSGQQIGEAMIGDTSGDMFNITVTGSATGDYFIVAAPLWDNSSVDSGLVRVITD